MSVFLLPKGVCQELSKLFAHFWWNRNDLEQKLHWVAWEKITEDKENGGLGFKDIQSFNLALLGKQVWRVLTRPNLLMSKILKHKYFPHTDLFHATCKTGDSWLWKGWVEATKFIREGCCWQVGNGGRINVWQDKWVQDSHFRKVSSGRPEGCSVGKVKELLNSNGAGWNDNLLNLLFNRADIQAIKKTPISVMGASDRMMWPFAKDGQYSVKSGYKYAQEWRRMAQGSVGTSSGRRPDESMLWNRIWSLNVKKKIQHFLWRACHNKLSVGKNLRRRGLNVDAICSQCGEDVETEEHLFFHCQRAKLIWKLAPVQWDGLNSVTRSIKDWWLQQGAAGKHGKLEDRHEFTTFLLWHMWKARNNWLFNSTKISEMEIIQQAWQEWLEFQSVQTNKGAAIQRTIQKSRREPWQKPELGCMKLNVSSDISADGLGTGLGVIARDGQGDMIQACSVARDGSCNPVVAELEAVRIALLVALQNSWRKIEIQVDIKAIADCLIAKVQPIMEATLIADDIFLLSNMFESCVFSYCHKSVNRAVSSLAKLAYTRKLIHSWKSDFSQWLLQEATFDIRSF